MLIKIWLLTFLVLSRYRLTCQYIIRCRISLSDTWHNNCQSGKAKRETRFNLLFEQKMSLACLFFKLILYQRFGIIYHLCLRAPCVALKLNTKQGTAKERIHLVLFLKYIRKKLCKGKC